MIACNFSLRRCLVGRMSALRQACYKKRLTTRKQLLSAHEVGRRAGRLAARVGCFIGINSWRQSGVDHMLYIVALFRNDIVAIRCRAGLIAGLVLHGASKGSSITGAGYCSMPANAA
jgi:hypothetical protein